MITDFKDYDALLHKLKWFINLFENELIKEGWCIARTAIHHTTTNNVFQTFLTYSIKNYYQDYSNRMHSTISMEQAREYAEQYGIICNFNDEIIDVDKTKIIRNTHLLRGEELGLI